MQFSFIKEVFPELIIKRFHNSICLMGINHNTKVQRIIETESVHTRD
jgi:hypothetical protein